MKFLEKHHLDNPVCKFTLANLDEVLVPFLEAQSDEIKEEKALNHIVRKALARANRFESPLLVAFYVRQALWTVCQNTEDCDCDFPGRWWGAWKSARAKTLRVVAEEMALAFQNDERTDLGIFLTSLTERHFADDERRIVELLTRWQGGEGPVVHLLFQEWQRLLKLQMERHERERRERIGSRQDQIARVWAYLDHAIPPHLSALAGRYRKLVKTGAYGEKIFKNWKKEVRYFGDEVLGMFHAPGVLDNDLDRDDLEEIVYDHITELVEERIAEDR